MEKIKEELNNLIDLYNERKNIEKLTKNIEEKNKELDILDNKVKLLIPETAKNIAEKELETAKKEFEKMQQDKKTQQEELNKKFESYKESLILAIDKEINKELDNLKSSKNAYEKIANNAEKTVEKLMNDFNNGKNINQSMLISARKEIETNRKKVTQLEKKIEEYVVGATNTEQYSDLTYLKMRVQGLWLEQLNENTEKDFYEKYFKDEEIIEPTKPEPVKPENNETIEPEIVDNNSIVDEYLKEKEKLIKIYGKILIVLNEIIELDKSGNYKEIDKKLQISNTYSEEVRKLLNKIEEKEKSGKIKNLDKENINKLSLINETTEKCLDEIMKMSNVIEEIEERATKSKDEQTINPQNNQTEQQEPTKPEDDKPTEPELTEQEQRKMGEEYLALEERILTTYNRAKNCLKNAFEHQKENKMGIAKLDIINAFNHEDSIKTYKMQLLKIEEKLKPYLKQEDIEKINEYKKQEKEYVEQIEKIKKEIKEAKNSINLDEIKNPNTLGKNGGDKINANNIKFIPNQEDGAPIIITYTTDDKEEHTRDAKYNLEKDDAKAMIKSTLKTVYPEIDFESEDGKQELNKYENADPNIVNLYRNNKERLEEYAGLLNGEIKRNKKDENSLKITYDISQLSKIDGISDKEKEAFEDYAFKHRHIAKVKKTLLQSVKFAFRGFKEKIFNSNKTKLLDSGITTEPLKEDNYEFDNETKESYDRAKEKKEKIISSINKESDEKVKESLENYNKNMSFYKERLNDKKILEERIANAKTEEEKNIYEEKLKEVKDELKTLIVGGNSNKTTEEQSKLDKTETDNKEKDASENKLTKYEEEAKKQDDEFKNLTSNWKDSIKVETKPEEREKTTETDDKKQELKPISKEEKLNEKIQKRKEIEKETAMLPENHTVRKANKLLLEVLDQQIKELEEDIASDREEEVR